MPVKRPLIVHAPDVARHEPRANQRHFHSGEPQLRRNRIRQRPHREFAHVIRRSSGRRRPSRNAPDDGQIAFAFLDLRKRRVNRSQHAKHIGLELPPVILHRQFFQRAHHAESRVGNRYVQLSPLAHGFLNGFLQTPILRHVARHHQRRRLPRIRNSFRQLFEQFPAPRRQRQLRSRLAQLPRQLLANPRRSSRDEHRLALKERLRPVHPRILRQDYRINRMASKLPINHSPNFS